MSREEFDVAIIGGGVVGASLARELTRWRVRVVVLDRAAELPSGASRANSSMIHGGFDDSPNTLKARFCPEGNRMYHALKDELDFHLDECGSYVCAFDDKDMAHLEKLLVQGRANGVPGLEIVTGERLRGNEPNVSPDVKAALWSPTAAIVNNFEAVVAFMESAKINGAVLRLETRVTGLMLDDRGEVRGVETDRGPVYVPIVVNAAGVHSEEVASWAGEPDFHITPTRGEYFLLDRTAGDFVTSFLFACPSERGKGVTVARTAEGNLLAGPTATVQKDGDDTATTPEGLAQVLEGARRLVPNFPVNLNITTFAGVRANTDTGDFVIEALKAPRGFVNVAGIKSPGFTSAPAIAVHVAEMIRAELGDRASFEPNPHFVPERRGIPRFAELPMEERARLAREDPAWGQIVCRCETVTEAQVLEAIRRGARTVAAVKIWTRAGAGRCQGGFCCPRVAEILARELQIPLTEVTRHGGNSRLLLGGAKEFLLDEGRGEEARS